MSMMALACALIGAVLVRFHIPGPGVLLMSLALWRWIRDPAQPAENPQGANPSPLEISILSGLTLVALVIRSVHLGTLPPAGINTDESRYGMFAIRFLRGETLWPPPDSTEALSVWSYAVAFWLFGKSLLVARGVSVLYGTSTIPLLWWAVRPLYGPGVALAASTALALMRWHILVSRIAQPYVLVPFAICVVLGAFARALRRSRTSDWAFFGIVAGSATYTYLAARIIPVLAGLVAFYHIRTERHQRRSRILHGLVCGGAMVVVMLPILSRFLISPESFTSRANFLLSETRSHPIHGIVRNAILELTAFCSTGDGFLSSSYPQWGDAPLLGPVGVAFLLLGLTGLTSGRSQVWNALVGLYAVSAFIIGLLAGMGFPGGSNRLTMLCPIIALAQGIALTRIAARSRAPLAVCALAFAAATSWEYAGFLHRTPWDVDRSVVGAWCTSPEESLASKMHDQVGGMPVCFIDTMEDAPLVVDKLLGASVFTTGTRVLRTSPRSLSWIWSHHAIGVALWSTRRHRELATEVFPHAVRLYPSPLTPGCLGLSLISPSIKSRMSVGEFRSTIHDLERASLMASEKRYDAALSVIARLSERYPWLALSHAVGAGILLAVGQEDSLDKAAVEAQRAVELSSGANPQAWSILAYVRFRRQTWGDAHAFWKRSLDLDPTQEDVAANYKNLDDMLKRFRP